MLEEARGRARANQSFVAEPPCRTSTTRLGPEHDATFDVVLSRAVLHWVPAADVPGVYRSAARLLKPGGWFRVECGGAGNIPKPLALMDDVSTSLGGPPCPWNFADPATALDWLEAAGLDAVTDPACFVRCVGQRRHFDETTLTGWLDSQVLHAYEASLPAAAHGDSGRGEGPARGAAARRRHLRPDLGAPRPAGPPPLSRSPNWPTLGGRMSEQLLTILKLCLLALLYLFFFRVVRAVWAELRAPAPAPAGAAPARPAAGAAAARPPAARPGRGVPTELVVTDPPERRGTTYPIGDELTVGRAGGCAISLPDDTYVSSLHARVFTANGKVLVEDLGSTNGTYVNRVEAHQPGDPRPRRPLQVGSTVLEARSP